MNTEQLMVEEKGIHWAVHALVGMLMGAVACLTIAVEPESTWAVTLHAALWTFVVTAGLTAQLSLAPGRERRSISASLAMGAVFAIPMAWIGMELAREASWASSEEDRLLTGIMTLSGSAFILLAFVRTWLDEGRLRFPYKRLFEHSLNALTIIAIAGFFTGAFWLLLVLWAGLFELLDIDFFSELFTDEYFVAMCLPVSASIGLALGRASENVVRALKRVLLVLCRVLLPMVALIVGLFLLALLFKGLDALWETNMAAGLLLAVQIVTIFLYNGVVQMGEEAPRSRIMRWVVEGLTLTLPLFAGLTLYALVLRIGQYGFTPERIWGLAACAVAGFYGVGYAVSVVATRLRPDGWMGIMRPVNVAMAIVVPLLMILLHTPVLDPLHMSARSQYARLLGGEADLTAYSFYGLRYEYGRLGREYVSSLEENLDAMQAAGEFTAEEAALIRERLDEEVYYGAQDPAQLAMEDVAMVDGETLDPLLFERILWVFENYGWYWDGEVGRVMARRIQADTDPELECLVYMEKSYDKLFLFDSDGADWAWVGTYGQNLEESVLMGMFPSAQVEPVARQYMDLEMNGSALQFNHQPEY